MCQVLHIIERACGRGCTEESKNDPMPAGCGRCEASGRVPKASCVGNRTADAGGELGLKAEEAYWQKASGELA